MNNEMCITYLPTPGIGLELRKVQLSEGDQEGLSNFLTYYFGSDSHECSSVIVQMTYQHRKDYS